MPHLVIVTHRAAHDLDAVRPRNWAAPTTDLHVGAAHSEAPHFNPWPAAGTPVPPP